ncbi:MAG TPA: DUF1080 domain-containing protein [Agriterribacter sp.]|nr:DUF1080 domain-containing protein [Agriterribacter sp.]
MRYHLSTFTVAGFLIFSGITNAQTHHISVNEKREGFRLLFNGNNFDGWTGDTVNYRIWNNCITTITTNDQPGGNLMTAAEYGNFIIRFEFELTAGANNGLGLRGPVEGDVTHEGMEIQLLDDNHEKYKDIKPYQFTGSLYGVAAAKRGHLRPVGEWNNAEVILAGNTIKVTLNGTVVLDYDWTEDLKNGTVDGLKHPGLLKKKGHLGFLGHGTIVRFRNIRIKKLD